MFGTNKNKKKKNKEFFSTLIAAVAVETHWGIAGTTTARTVIWICHMSMAC